jgi:fructoselysine-6-P-deglycase FrlB-like protein
MSQPKLLGRIEEHLRELSAVDLPVWEDGMTLGVLAMGASRNSSHALVAALAVQGVRAVNPPASEILLARPGFSPADYLLIVSESGRSPEPLEAARRIGGPRRVAITNFPESPIAEVVDATVGFGGVPDSRVYTVGYAATLVAYAHIADRLGLRPLDSDVSNVAALVAEALHRYGEQAAHVGEWIAGASGVDVAGRGVSFASAAEFALMLREGVRLPSALYETYEYLHGPMEAVSGSTVVVLFGDGREATLPDRLVDADVRVILITSAAGGSVPAEGHPLLEIIRLPPDLSPFMRPIVEIVIGQLILVAASERSEIVLDDFVFEGLGTKLDARSRPPREAGWASEVGSHQMLY